MKTKWSYCLFLFVFCGFFMLTACEEGIRISEQILIQGVGIDCTDGVYTATLHAAKIDEGEEKDIQILQASGESAFDALTNVTMTDGREPMFSHNMIIVFGRECAERGLNDVLDFFVRYHETRPEVNVFVSESTAEQVLQVKNGDTYVTSRQIQELAGASSLNGKTVDVKVMNLVNQLTDPGVAAYLPMLKAEKETVRTTGTAIFSGDKMVDILGDTETRGFLFAVGKLQGGTEVVDTHHSGNTTLSIWKSSSKIEAGLEGGNPVFKIEISCGADTVSYTHLIHPGKDQLLYCSFQYVLPQRILSLKPNGNIARNLQYPLRSPNCYSRNMYCGQSG